MLTYYTTFTDNVAKVTILAETALLSVIGLRFFYAHNKKTTKSLEVSDNHRIFAADKIDMFAYV